MAKSGLHKLRDGWAAQIRVIHALMIRELITRFGRENIGFLWIMAEPLLFGGLVGIIWHFTHGPTEHGIGIMAFVATGYIPITLFRHSVSRSVAVFTVNQSLLYHRQIKIVDFIIARFNIELLGGMMAYLFMGIVLHAVGEFPVPDDIGLLIAGWFLYALFCFSLCLIIAPLSEVSEAMEKFVPVTTYVMIPFSGLLYLVSWMHPSVRDFLLLSPFVNCMEMMRKGIWGANITAYYNIWNPIGCTIVFTMFGLILCRVVRGKLSVE
ncbi:capsule biosynthesis protein [Sphingobium terrigena]|uniref:Capsule biosynthesis protein n=1 Tax=Sphingobium terrigena TaxID=2304063 RepID=A0A418YXX1_9SPHN|nr:ABC transporter permease [Sphingobium terrigena]RJG57717.1 capsule biosynthesis protein [Sphingobium terrigena]